MSSTLFVSGVTASASAWANDVDTASYNYLTSPAGTNTITATGPTSMTAYAAGQMFKLVPAATNTGATTVNINSLGAKNLFSGGVACVGGELVIGVPALIVYDGTQFNVIGQPRIRLATEQASTSGTTIDFTGIPAGARRITIAFVGVSTNGTSDLLIQIGDSGGIEASGYLGCGIVLGATVVAANYTTGFGFKGGAATNIYHGSVTLDLENAAAFTWVANGNLGLSDSAFIYLTAGSKSLSAELDRVRITTVGGVNTFDAGAINISYE